MIPIQDLHIFYLPRPLLQVNIFCSSKEKLFKHEKTVGNPLQISRELPTI